MYSAGACGGPVGRWWGPVRQLPVEDGVGVGVFGGGRFGAVGDADRHGPPGPRPAVDSDDAGFEARAASVRDDGYGEVDGQLMMSDEVGLPFRAWPKKPGPDASPSLGAVLLDEFPVL